MTQTSERSLSIYARWGPRSNYCILSGMVVLMLLEVGHLLAEHGVL